MVDFDPEKAARNLRKHGVTLAEGETVLSDLSAITVTDDDSDPNEQRFVTLGMSARGRLLVAVYTYRADEVRMISARKATSRESKRYYEA